MSAGFRSGSFLTSCSELRELELAPERLPVVLVNEVVNALLDHVRLRTQRQDSPYSQVHCNRCSGAKKMQPRSIRLPEIKVDFWFSADLSQKTTTAAAFSMFGLIPLNALWVTYNVTAPQRHRSSTLK